MSEDHFLKDLWEHKVEEEKGETQEDKDLGLYLRFFEDAKHYPTLGPVLVELKDKIISYARSVGRFSQATTFDKEELVSADRHRRLIHNSLIDTVNQLSRKYNELGIDNSWRNDILNRRHLGEWALAIAKRVLGEQFP